MKTRPSYNELLLEMDRLKQLLEEKKKLENEQELSVAKEKAAKSEVLYHRLIENSPWGMHFYRLDNGSLVFTGANPAADKLLHLENSKFIGKTIEEAFPPLVQTEIPFRYREAAEKGLMWNTEQITYKDNKITGAFEVIAFQTTGDNMVAVFNDITERKQHEKQLKDKNEEFLKLNKELKHTNNELIYAKQCIEKSEERFRLLLGNSNDVFVLINRNGDQFYISDVAERDTGFSIEELKGPIQDVIYPPDLHIVMQAWEKVLHSKGEVVRVQYRHKHRQKDYIWYEAVAQNYIDHPAINAVVVNLRDITAIKETEAKLIEAKEHAEASELKIKQQSEEIENYFNCAIDLLCIANTDGYFERLNQEWLNVLGYSLEELEGKRFLDFVHPDDVAPTMQVISELADKSKILNFTNRYRCKNGSYRWIEWRSYPHGKKIYAAARDITERRRVEEELRKNEILTRTAIENLPIIFYMIDDNGFFKLSIGAGLQSLDLQPNQVVGISAFELYRDHPQIIESIQKSLSGETVSFESNVNGAIHFNIVTPYSITDKRFGIVGVALDITERKQIELEAILAKEKAEENDRLKTAFLQNMSHEIRTPMNAIMGFASLMAENYNNREKMEEYSGIIEDRCNDLLAIINDILDISKIESGQGTLLLEACNINEVFTELALFFADYQSRTGKKNIQLVMHDVPDEHIAVVITDKYKLRQILINLITNAFKFTESGKIECGCKLSNNQLLFHVSDTGVGIPREKQEFVFERFTRIETIISKSYVGGTGLGLPIVKGLVGLLGGKVWLESERNKGTTFYFTIDYKKPEGTHPAVDAEDRTTQHFVSGKSILIVEDDANNALYLKELLIGCISNVYVVGTGLDAIKMVQKQSIDLVLMDVRLPDITGYEATKAILHDLPGMKIIAQTAYAANEERLRAINAGCVDYVSKPTKREQLLSVIGQYL